MQRLMWMTGVWLFGLAILTGCNFNSQPQGGLTPSIQANRLERSPTPPLDTAAQLPTETVVTPEPSPALVTTASPLPSASPIPSTNTPLPISTPGPYEHTIQQGETLIEIVQQYGYTDFTSIIDEVVRANNNIPNADFVPGEGNVILIPRQTATPTPEGSEISDGGLAVTLVIDTSIVCYTVEEGDSLVGIAEQYETTLEILSQLNRDLDWFGCDFSTLSGGPDCNPLLQINACINVPAPTPIPTFTPTPSGNETATPTPTFPPPVVSSPPEGAIAEPGLFRLQWASVGILQGDEVYLVEIQDQTNGGTFSQVTRQTSIWLPASMIPEDGQVHTIHWRVTVARPDADGVYTVVSGAAPVHTFEIRSR